MHHVTLVKCKDAIDRQATVVLTIQRANQVLPGQIELRLQNRLPSIRHTRFPLRIRPRSGWGPLHRTLIIVRPSGDPVGSDFTGRLQKTFWQKGTPHES